MKKIKEEKGITLVALIITIVVLLILAVVSIGAVQNSDIIGHAQDAKESFEDAKNNEIETLLKNEEEIEKNIPKNEGNGNEIKPGYFVIKDVYNGIELAEIWYIEVKDTNKISVIYYYVEDNVLIRTIDCGEAEVVEDKVNSVSVTNGFDGSTEIIQPSYFVMGEGASKSYIKGDKLFVAENPEQENCNYIISVLDQNFVLPDKK